MTEIKTVHVETKRFGIVGEDDVKTETLSGKEKCSVLYDICVKEKHSKLVALSGIFYEEEVDLKEFDQIMDSFNQSIDLKIVTLLKNYCEKSSNDKTMKTPSKIIVKDFNPSQQLITFCKLPHDLSIHKLRSRVRFLQEVNQRITLFLKFVNLTIDRGLSLLTDIFFNIHGLIFFETKSEIMNKILLKSKVDPSKSQVIIDRVAATRMIQEKKWILN